MVNITKRVPGMGDHPAADTQQDRTAMVVDLLKNNRSVDEIREHIRNHVAPSGRALMKPLNNWIKAQTAESYPEKERICQFVNDLVSLCGLTIMYDAKPCYLRASQGADHSDGRINVIHFGSSHQAAARREFSNMPPLSLARVNFAQHPDVSPKLRTWVSRLASVEQVHRSR